MKYECTCGKQHSRKSTMLKCRSKQRSKKSFQTFTSASKNLLLFENFTLANKFASGGYGDIYLCFDKKNKLFALKRVLKNDDQNDIELEVLKKNLKKCSKLISYENNDISSSYILQLYHGDVNDIKKYYQYGIPEVIILKMIHDII